MDDDKIYDWIDRIDADLSPAQRHKLILFLVRPYGNISWLTCDAWAQPGYEDPTSPPCAKCDKCFCENCERGYWNLDYCFECRLICCSQCLEEYRGDFNSRWNSRRCSDCFKQLKPGVGMGPAAEKSVLTQGRIKSNFRAESKGRDN